MKMDFHINEDEISIPQVVYFASITFFIIILLGFLIYISCSKKYRLNWFEKNLLETAKEVGNTSQSQEVLVATGIEDGDNSSMRSFARSPNSPTDGATFWTPTTALKTQPHTSGLNDENVTPPTSPTESHGSLSLGSGSNVPIARTDKHVVLAMNPTRPRVATMQGKLDHTKIDTTLYEEKTTNPETSNLSEDSHGSIQLTLSFDVIGGMLNVHLHEAQDLQPREFSGTADPYAMIRLLPDKKTVWHTRIHKRTLNPVFDEDFVFDERNGSMGERILEILLYDFDAYSRHVCIGGARIPLTDIDLTQKLKITRPLQVSTNEQEIKSELGELEVILSFLPSAGRLTVSIVRAKNLRIIDVTRNSTDPYVRVTLRHNGKKLKKKKTAIIRNTINPLFNEALMFDVSRDVLKNSTIEFEVLHDSLLGSNEFLGYAIMGKTSETKSQSRSYFDDIFRAKTTKSHWLQLIDKDTKDSSKP